jgi:hypothetical protein
MVKELKYFITYILHSKVVSYVPNNTVKEILTQPNTNGKRGRWIAKILVYEMDIKPTKLVKGQGLLRLLEESNYKSLGLNFIFNHPTNGVSQNDGNNFEVHQFVF